MPRTALMRGDRWSAGLATVVESTSSNRTGLRVAADAPCEAHSESGGGVRGLQTGRKRSSRAMHLGKPRTSQHEETCNRGNHQGTGGFVETPDRHGEDGRSPVRQPVTKAEARGWIAPAQADVGRPRGLGSKPTISATSSRPMTAKRNSNNEDTPCNSNRFRGSRSAHRCASHAFRSVRSQPCFVRKRSSTRRSSAKRRAVAPRPTTHNSAENRTPNKAKKQSRPVRVARHASHT